MIRSELGKVKVTTWTGISCHLGVGQEGGGESRRNGRDHSCEQGGEVWKRLLFVPQDIVSPLHF